MEGRGSPSEFSAGDDSGSTFVSIHGRHATEATDKQKGITMTALPKSFTPDPDTAYLWDAVPEHLKEGLVRYFDHGIIPGSFLAAALENNLTQAIINVDDWTSILDIKGLIDYLRFCAPGPAWGSAARVALYAQGFLRARTVQG